MYTNKLQVEEKQFMLGNTRFIIRVEHELKQQMFSTRTRVSACY